MAERRTLSLLREPLLVLTRAIPRQVTWADPLVLAGLAALLWATTHVAGQWAAPLRRNVELDLSLSALPLYTLYSLARGFTAFLISFAFTLVYGWLAARNRAAEQVLVPLLDILQSIPVLGFMPGLVLALVALFPNSNFGLEAAAVLMIFTGQVWNLTFSFYHSLRNLPPELEEAARLFRFGTVRTFFKLELPYAGTGLVWNGMMSMAGGWFFLTINEAFQLGDQDFRLPGVGAYMSVAIDRGDFGAMAGAVVAMGLMIVLVDQLFWRPLVAWSEKFNTGDARAEAPTSWVLDLLRRSGVVSAASDFIDSLLPEPKPVPVPDAATVERRRRAGLFSQYAVLGLFSIGALAGAVKLLDLLRAVPFEAWLRLCGSALLTLVRTTVAVALASLWTVPVGVMIGRNPKLARVAQPVVQLAASFPAPMLFPLVLVGFQAIGIGLQVSSVVLMMLGTQWYVLFNVIAGAMSLPNELHEVARIYRFERKQTWRQLWLPGVFPHLVTGWVTAAGGAWNASIVSEYLRFRGETHVATGLGSLISEAAAKGDFPTLAAGVLVMAGLVVGINKVVWKRLYVLAETRYALTR